MLSGRFPEVTGEYIASPKLCGRLSPEIMWKSCGNHVALRGNLMVNSHKVFKRSSEKRFIFWHLGARTKENGSVTCGQKKWLGRGTHPDPISGTPTSTGLVRRAMIQIIWKSWPMMDKQYQATILGTYSAPKDSLVPM